MVVIVHYILEVDSRCCDCPSRAHGLISFGVNFSLVIEVHTTHRSLLLLVLKIKILNIRPPPLFHDPNEIRPILRDIEL